MCRLFRCGTTVGCLIFETSKSKKFKERGESKRQREIERIREMKENKREETVFFYLKLLKMPHLKDIKSNF